MLRTAYYPKTKYYAKRILFIVTLFVALFCVYFFRVPGISVLNIYIENPIARITTNLDLWLYFVVYFTIVFFINFLLLAFFTIYLVKKKKKREDRNEQLKIKLLDYILDLLFIEKDYSENYIEIFLNDIKKKLKTYTEVRLFFELLIQTNSILKGKLKDRIIYIGQKAINKKFINKHLSSPYFDDKVFALRLISNFSCDYFTKKIYNLTNHKNYLVRNEAYITLIILSEIDSLMFLKKYNKNISMLDVNTIITTIKEYNRTNLDYFGLISSDNPRVAIIGVVLAKIFKKYEYAQIIKTRLADNNLTLRDEAYKAYVSLIKNDEDFDIIFDKFPTETIEIKNTILDLIEKYPDKNTLKNFLLKVVEIEPVQIKIKALKILLDIDMSVFNYLQKINNAEIQEAIKQVLDFQEV